jgi:hypothetical protein
MEFEKQINVGRIAILLSKVIYSRCEWIKKNMPMQINLQCEIDENPHDDRYTYAEFCEKKKPKEKKALFSIQSGWKKVIHRLLLEYVQERMNVASGYTKLVEAFKISWKDDALEVEMIQYFSKLLTHTSLAINNEHIKIGTHMMSFIMRLGEEIANMIWYSGDRTVGDKQLPYLFNTYYTLSKHEWSEILDSGYTPKNKSTKPAFIELDISKCKPVVEVVSVEHQVPE